MPQKERHQEQEPEILDDATVQAIRHGLESEETGNFLTMEEAVQFAKQRRKAWQTVQTVHVTSV